MKPTRNVSEFLFVQLRFRAGFSPFIDLSLFLELVSKLAEAKKTRGKRLEDGTAQRDRPHYEVLYVAARFVLSYDVSRDL